MPPSALSAAPEPHVATLPNGVRALTIPMLHLHTVHVSVFVRSGSQHEDKSLNGVSHFVEHMAFKGTHTRSCQRINLDAERLGAEVNAHTDRDHTAFHMHGLPEHTAQFVQMLGDIVREGSFPEVELERERQVILQEFAEDEDDALSTAFKLFDKTCFGEHPVARPVIGTRRHIERFSRADLLDYVRRQYTGANVVVGVAGPVDPDAVARAVEAAFGSMAAGTPNQVDPPTYVGGLATRRIAGYSQAHLVLGFPIPALPQPHDAAVVAAALYGEGMSSPLLDQIRERRGLAYHAACSADVMPLAGQFVIEASTAPEHVDEFFTEAMRLLHEQAERTDPVDLSRARNQIRVRGLRAQERAVQRVESAAQDLFVFGRLRPREELMARLDAVDAAQVRAVFEQMLATPAAVAIAGRMARGAGDRVQAAVAPR